MTVTFNVLPAVVDTWNTAISVLVFTVNELLPPEVRVAIPKPVNFPRIFTYLLEQQ